MSIVSAYDYIYLKWYRLYYQIHSLCIVSPEDALYVDILNSPNSPFVSEIVGWWPGTLSGKSPVTNHRGGRTGGRSRFHLVRAWHPGHARGSRCRLRKTWKSFRCWYGPL